MDKYLKIDKQASWLARNWYLKKSKDYTIFQNISLGQAIEFEVTILFVAIIKSILFSNKKLSSFRFKQVVKKNHPHQSNWFKKILLYQPYLYWQKLKSFTKETVYFDPYTIYHDLPRLYFKDDYFLIGPRAKEYFLNNHRQKSTNDLTKKIIVILTDHKDFIDQCRVKNFNFWPLIKNDFYHLLKTELPQKINEVVLAKKFIRFFNIKKTLLPWDQVGFYKILALTANRMGLKTYRYQDGIYGNFKYVESLTSKKALVWGKNGVDFFKSLNVPSENIVTIGNPSLLKLKKITGQVNKERVKNNLKIEKDKKVVLYAGSAFEGLSAFDYHELHTRLLALFCQAAEQLPRIVFIVKLHGPEQNTREIRSIVKNNNRGNIILIDKYNFYQLLSVGDILVSRASTALIEALLINKPCISINVTKLDIQINPYRKCQGILFAKNPNELKNNIKKLLTNKELTKKLRLKAKKFIKENIVNYASP